MPYRSHSRFGSIGYVALAVAAVVALVAIVYLIGTRDGDEPGYEPPAVAKDRASDADPGREEDGRRRDKSSASPEDDAGPDWFGELGTDADAAPGPHQAVITVTSSPGTAVGLKYAFRTPGGIRSGLTQATSSWSDSATVSGGEPLAGVIAQVASGTVSCSVRIDGRVTSHRTSSGSFATVTCAG